MAALAQNTPKTVLKLSCGNDTRRIGLVSSSMSYKQLEKLAAYTFNLHLTGSEANAYAEYKDDEGRQVRITGDSDLSMAFKSVDSASKESKSLRIEIVESKSVPGSKPASKAQSSDEEEEDQERKREQNKTAAEKQAAGKHTCDTKPIKQKVAYVRAIPVKYVEEKAERKETTPKSTRRTFQQRHQEERLAKQQVAERVRLRRAAFDKDSDSPYRSGSQDAATNKTSKPLPVEFSEEKGEHKETASDTSSQAKRCVPKRVEVYQSTAAKAGETLGRPPSQDSANCTPLKPVPLCVLSGTLEISSDGMVQSGKNTSVFSSVGALDVALVEGKWYWESDILSNECMQIGWATPGIKCDTAENGVGDCAYSWAYDGTRQKKWHKGRSEPWGPRWKTQQTVCCALDLDNGKMYFALNGNWDYTFGKNLAFKDLLKSRELEQGIFPAVSLAPKAQCRIRFGAPGNLLRYGPPDSSYKTIWQSFGTHTANLRNLPKIQTLSSPSFSNTSMKSDKKHNGELLSASKASKSESGKKLSSAKPAFCLPDSRQELVTLLIMPEVRSAISKALSEPGVAAAIQALLCTILISGKDGVSQWLHDQINALVPIFTNLMAEHPVLTAAGTQLLTILQDVGLMSSGDCYFNALGKLFNSHLSPSPCRNIGDACGGTHGRASRDIHSSAHLGSSMEQTDLLKAIEASLQSAANEDRNESAKMVDDTRQSTKNKTNQKMKKTEENLCDERQKKNSKRCSSESAHISDEKSQTDRPITETSSGRYEARLITDALSSKLTATPRQTFSHSWRLCNSGNQSWSAVSVKCTGGDKLIGCDVVKPVYGKDGKSSVAPGETVDVLVELVAPMEPGRYVSYWRLQDTESGEKFGDRIKVELTVSKTEKEEEGVKSTNKLDADSTKTRKADKISTPNTSDAKSECTAKSTHMQEEPDWVQIRNMLVGMSNGAESAN